MKPAKAQRGITIIEILIAIAVFGILIALGAPSSMKWIQNLQIRNAAESVANGLKTARLEALRRNTTVAFELTDQNSTAWHVCLWDTSSSSCAGGQPDIAYKAATEGGQNARVGVESPFTTFGAPLGAGTGFPARVAFDPLGRVSNTVLQPIARVDVRNPQLAAGDERRLSVFVGPAGQIFVCDPSLVQTANPQGCPP